MDKRLAQISQAFFEVYGDILSEHQYDKKRIGFYKLNEQKNFLHMIMPVCYRGGENFDIKFDALPFSHAITTEQLSEGKFSVETVFMRFNPSTYMKVLRESIQERMESYFCIFRDHIFPLMTRINNPLDCYNFSRDYYARYIGEEGSTIRRIWECISIEDYNQALFHITVLLKRDNAWIRTKKEQIEHNPLIVEQLSSRFEYVESIVQDLTQLQEKIELEDYPYLQMRVKRNIEASLLTYNEYIKKVV